MEMRRISTVAAAGLLFTGLAGQAFAYDFTFTVPIQFSGLPSDVYQFALSCDAELASGLPVGHALRMVPITGGGYSGDVTLQFNADPGRDPATAVRYSCSAYFFGRDPPGAVGPRYFYDPSSPTFPLVAGAPFRLRTGLTPLP
jgi:hypothetical protein